jgi:hypothetical protein
MDLSERDAHLMALADNRSQEFADWDVPMLLLDMETYSLPEIELAGWDQTDLDKLSKDLTLPDGDLDGDDPFNDVDVILVELKVKPENSEGFLKSLKELVAGYDGIELNIS